MYACSTMLYVAQNVSIKRVESMGIAYGITMVFNSLNTDLDSRLYASMISSGRLIRHCLIRKTARGEKLMVSMRLTGLSIALILLNRRYPDSCVA